MSDDRDRFDKEQEKQRDKDKREKESAFDEIPEGLTQSILGGLNPMDLLRDPMGAIQKLFSDPKAMKSINAFMETPMAREIMSQGFDSPILKQMMSGNPMMEAMMQSMTQQFGDLSTTFSEEAEEIEEEAEEIEDPILPLLNPPHGGSVYPLRSPVKSFEILLKILPEALRPKILEIAESRYQHHLTEEERGILDKEAKGMGRHSGLDLLVSQGTFMGEVSWHAICHLEEEVEEADQLAPLAKHALNCVTLNCGWRIPSFTPQLLQFLIEVDKGDEDDLRYAIWALAAQPKDGIDGIFDLDIEETEEFVEVLLNWDVDLNLRLIFLIAYVGWREWEEEVQQAFLIIFEALKSISQEEVMLDQMLELLKPGKTIEGIDSRTWTKALKHLVLYKAMEKKEMGALLNQALYWSLEEVDLHKMILEAMDQSWADLSSTLKKNYLTHLLKSERPELRHQAYILGAAWEPQKYLQEAMKDEDMTIREWAEQEWDTL